MELASSTCITSRDGTKGEKAPRRGHSRCPNQDPTHEAREILTFVSDRWVFACSMHLGRMQTQKISAEGSATLQRQNRRNRRSRHGHGQFCVQLLGHNLHCACCQDFFNFACQLRRFAGVFRGISGWAIRRRPAARPRPRLGLKNPGPNDSCPILAFPSNKQNPATKHPSNPHASSDVHRSQAPPHAVVAVHSA